jgi:hypothetical protein
MEAKPLGFRVCQQARSRLGGWSIECVHPRAETADYPRGRAGGLGLLAILGAPSGQSRRQLGFHGRPNCCALLIRRSLAGLTPLLPRASPAIKVRSIPVERIRCAAAPWSPVVSEYPPHFNSIQEVLPHGTKQRDAPSHHYQGDRRAWLCAFG